MKHKRRIRRIPEKLAVRPKDNKPPASSPVSFNAEVLKEVFKKNPDVQFSELNLLNQKIVLIYCNGLVNHDFLLNTIPVRLEKFLQNAGESLSKETVLQGLNLPSLSCINKKEEAVDEVFSGKLLIDLGLRDGVFTVDISERPERQPEDTRAEATILGPRDDFIEDISVNLSLIRKRLRTTSLVYEEFLVGKRTKTRLFLVYMDDIVNPEILNKIREKLSSISVDGLLGGTQLEELIEEKHLGLFPRHKYTGKPDFAVQTLLSGRFVILIDGVATAYITPVNFNLLFKSNEDKEYNYVYSSFTRVLRISGLLASTLLPGAWIAFTTFHQEQLPLTLLATVVETRRGIPFPTTLEALAMLILFDLFREAGVRLPMTIGQILSVVGGLIIGDAAIRSGLTSPSMLVVIAMSTVSTFTLVDQALIGTLSLMRLFAVVMSSLLGFVGLLMSFYIFVTNIGKIQVFGIPYLSGMNEFNKEYFFKTVFKLPDPLIKKRPEDLNLSDKTKRDEG